MLTRLAAWCLLALPMMPALAADAVAPAPVAAVAASHDPYVQLQELSKLAPSRQVGQPGNEAIDRHIQSRFEQAVTARNDPQRWSQAQALLAKAAEAQNNLYEVQRLRQTLVQSDQLADSSLLVQLTLEDPSLPATILLLLTLLVLGCWYLQRRRSLLALGGVLGVVTVGLPLLALMVTTASEKQSQGEATAGSNMTTAQLDRQVADASAAVLKADLDAAEALRGLWQSGRIGYPTAAFIPGKTTLGVGERSVDLHQLAPNYVDPGNLPERGFSGPLVYVGSATPQELSGRKLEGAAAVIEFDSANRWIDAVQLGAELVIVLAPRPGETAQFAQAAQKISTTPLAVPRFYATREAMAQVLGDDWINAMAGQAQAVIQQAPGRWERRNIYIDWLFIPAAGEPGKPSRELVHLQAYKDSASVVPELSPGANSAGNLVLMLRLLDQFQKAGPARPVLMSVVNGHANGLKGEQEFVFNAFAPAEVVLPEMDWLNRELAKQHFIHGLYSQEPSDALLSQVRYQAVNVGGQVLKSSKAALDRLRFIRNEARARSNSLATRLKRLKEDQQADPAKIKELTDRIELLTAEAQTLNELMSLFNRFDPGGRRLKFDTMAQPEQQRVRELFIGIREEAQRKVAQLELQRDTLMNNLALRRRLLWLTHDNLQPQDLTDAQSFAARHTPLPAALLLALDLSFDGDRAGLFAQGNLVKDGAIANEASQRISRLADYSLKVASAYEKQTGEPSLLVDTLRNVGGVPWNAHLGGRYALASHVAHYYALPGLTLATVQDSRPRAFTPHDTVDRISPQRLGKLMAFAQGYIPLLIGGEDLSRTRRAVGRMDAVSVELNVRLLDEQSTTVPETPVPDALVTMSTTSFDVPLNSTMLGEVTPWPVVMTDVRGVAMLRGGVWRKTFANVFKYDPDYRQMLVTLDMGMGEKKYSSQLTLARLATFVPWTVLGFQCRKVDLIGMTEALTLAPVTKVTVLDAFQDSPAQHYATVGMLAAGSPKTPPLSLDGTASVMMDPLGAFKLRLGSGLAINASEARPEGVGFAAQSGMVRDLVITSAQDMWRLTDKRLELLSSKGVVNDTAEAFNKRAGASIARAKADEEQGRNADRLVNAEVARGMAFRAYVRGLSTINDLIKAVVIFLALVIPFCFFITKLITPFTDVNRQIALFGGVFLAMAVTLRYLHPAFEVAKTPAVVILAFIIMGLAMFVAGILMSRFNSSMNQAVEQSLMAESADAPQSRLAGVAFLVGVNNMKRRRIRTSLTCATVVLVTFTMLSVISVGQDVDPARVRMGRQTPYTGILYARPALTPIPEVQARRLRAHFEKDATVVARVWAQRLGDFNSYLPYELYPTQPLPEAAVESLQAKVLLGLEAAENGVLGAMPILPGGRWFVSNDAQEILLSVEGARLLGITPQNFQGRTLILEGMEVKLIGLLDDEAFAQMKDMADLPLLPLLTEARQEKIDENALNEAQAAGTAKLEASGDLSGGSSARAARPLDIAVVPIEMAKRLGDGAYRTVAIKFDRSDYRGADGNPATASDRTWAAAVDMVNFQHARIQVGLDAPVSNEQGASVEPGQYALASSSSTEIGGIIKIAIPIILAATIILNTMLGSVMERRREVGIYNAIGLNPGHVMVFFLAESLVFGLVGSVAGYLIGQALSLFITYTNILDINLNYSSLSVMVVIFLTISTVLLSTVYPAMMAARAAVPSGQRRWSLPQPQGDQIVIKFPFIYDAKRVLGVCAYLRDYMLQNSEASTGKFLAKLGPVGMVPTRATSGAAGGGDAPDHAYAMLFDIAPAPFDLGVNQKMEVYAYYDPHVKAHMLSVHLTRVSGEINSWVRVNQLFLESLRKRLLGWRSQKAQTHEAFYSEGQKLFADARTLPVVSATQEAR
jgi:hypothetical protein